LRRLCALVPLTAFSTKIIEFSPGKHPQHLFFVCVSSVCSLLLQTHVRSHKRLTSLMLARTTKRGSPCVRSGVSDHACPTVRCRSPDGNRSRILRSHVPGRQQWPRVEHSLNLQRGALQPAFLVSRPCAASSKPIGRTAHTQDHPDDRAWLKFVFDHTSTSGELTRENVPVLLINYYRNRFEGNTMSGTSLRRYPQQEHDFILALFDTDPSSTIGFDRLVDALQEAQGVRTRASWPPRPRRCWLTLWRACMCLVAANFEQPTPTLEYRSAAVLRADKAKHTRNVLHPQQQFRKPMATSQEVGWELYTTMTPDVMDPAGRNPFHLRTSATTQFADAMEKMTWGRSIAGEFSAYAMRKLAEFGGQGMGV
jgi:hypothetical protein